MYQIIAFRSWLGNKKILTVHPSTREAEAIWSLKALQSPGSPRQWELAWVVAGALGFRSGRFFNSCRAKKNCSSSLFYNAAFDFSFTAAWTTVLYSFVIMIWGFWKKGAKEGPGAPNFQNNINKCFLKKCTIKVWIRCFWQGPETSELSATHLRFNKQHMRRQGWGPLKGAVLARKSLQGTERRGLQVGQKRTLFS